MAGDAAPAEELIGEVLANRYQIEQRLGEGAMGTVYKARHVKVGRPFAVKVLHPRLLLDSKVLQRFEREAELAGRLRHPNVIGVVDVGETATGLRYMVMDFAEGPDLAALLCEAPMPPARIIHLVRQLLEGLYHAHEQGLIHRDFKPENVIIERDTHGAEVPRIVDFGIAILREGGESPGSPGRLTTNGLVLGTPHYMAPEQAVADPIDHRIDLFALGIITYELLCGKLPFDGSGAEIARANLMLDPPPISQRVPYLEVDPLLEAFARRLMAKKRDLRPPTAKAARDLLELIERDRDAAAAQLGVPNTPRAPKTTMPSAPQQPPGDHPGTFPPPIREQLATPPQAPPVRTPVAIAGRGEAQIATDTAEPLPFETRRRRNPRIVAALAGLLVLGVAAAIYEHGSSKSAPAPPPPAVASITPAPAQTASPAPSPPAPAPTPAPSGSAVAAGGSDAAPVAPAPTPPTPVEHVEHVAAHRHHGATARPLETANVATPEVQKPADEHPAAAKPLDAAGLASLYESVGAQLQALEDAKGTQAASDLWSRYRYIRITDAMSTQAKRDEATAVLVKIRSDIARRK